MARYLVLKPVEIAGGKSYKPGDVAESLPTRSISFLREVGSIETVREGESISRAEREELREGYETAVEVAPPDTEPTELLEQADEAIAVGSTDAPLSEVVEALAEGEQPTPPTTYQEEE